MAKLKRVEVSIERTDHSSAQFLVFDEESNRLKFRSQVYTERGNCVRGAKRYAKSNDMKIVRWLK